MLKSIRGSDIAASMHRDAVALAHRRLAAAHLVDEQPTDLARYEAQLAAVSGTTLRQAAKTIQRFLATHDFADLQNAIENARHLPNLPTDRFRRIGRRRQSAPASEPLPRDVERAAEDGGHLAGYYFVDSVLPFLWGSIGQPVWSAAKTAAGALIEDFPWFD